MDLIPADITSPMPEKGKGKSYTKTHLNHLHLHVRDLPRSQRFYESYLGFREHIRHGEILFLRNEDGFDLALAPEVDPESFPEWFHFGFRLAAPEAVRELYSRMSDEGVRIRKPLLDDEDLVSFQCLDPDGYHIEVYWE